MEISRRDRYIHVSPLTLALSRPSDGDRLGYLMGVVAGGI